MPDSSVVDAFSSSSGREGTAAVSRPQGACSVMGSIPESGKTLGWNSGSGVGMEASGESISEIRTKCLT